MSIDFTPTRIAVDRAVIEAATPGPWWNESGVVHAKGPQWTPENHSCVHPLNGEWEDAEFAAAARTGWPAALDEIERLQKRLDNACDSCACEIANERDQLLEALKGERNEST